MPQGCSRCIITCCLFLQDVVNAEQARIAEEAGACAVMVSTVLLKCTGPGLYPAHQADLCAFIRLLSVCPRTFAS